MNADDILLKWQHDEGICVPKTCAHCKLERAEGKHTYRTLKLADDATSTPGAEAWGVDPNGSKF